jgi:hypothetical protein
MKKVLVLFLMFFVFFIFTSCTGSDKDEFEIRTIVYLDGEWGKTAYVEVDGIYSLGNTYKTKETKLSVALNVLNNVDGFTYSNNILTFNEFIYPDIVVITDGKTVIPDVTSFILREGDVVLIIAVS